MDKTSIKPRLIRITLIALSIEILMLIFPAVIIIPADFIIGIITSNKAVDGWTHGVMVWLAFLYIVPAMYVITMMYIYVKRQN
jgi:hypothetical protein